MFYFDQSLLPASVSPVFGKIFHYTSAAGLLGMVECRVIWASEASSLNDRSEVVMGWELHKKWLEQQTLDAGTRQWATISADGMSGTQGHPQDNVYVACCSTSGDDVAQWRSYAGDGTGYSVELDASVSLSVWTTVSRGEAPQKNQVKWGQFQRDHAWVSPWLRVVYEESALFKLFDEVLDAFRGRKCYLDRMGPGDDPEESEDERTGEYQEFYDDYVTAMSMLVHLYKAAGYAGENEVRIVVGVPSGSPHVRFRASKAGVIGYLPLAASRTSDAKAVVDFSCGGQRPVAALPIGAVTLGSKLDPSHRATVKRMLNLNEITQAAVGESALRMR